MAWFIFQNLVSTAALAVVVAALCRFTRLGPVARHALWVLVLVKFVTPPLVVWPWAAPDPFGLSSIPSLASRDIVHGLEVRPEPGAGSHFSSPLVREVASSSPLDIWPWIFGLWIAGSLAVLAIEIVRVSRMSRRVNRPRSVDPAVIQRAAELSAQLGIRPVPVVGVVGRDAPAVWGLGKPRLLWPAELAADASDACIDGLLLHELAHIKRRDHVVGWIELAAGVAWWWNPVFWQVRSALREQAELACDAWVISQLPDGRRAYAESLLALSGPEVRGVPPVAVMGMRAGSRRLLERRLVMIMKGRSAVRLPRTGTLSLALLALATLPAWATSVDQTTATTAPVTPSVKQATTVPVIVEKQEKPAVKTVVTKTPKGEQTVYRLEQKTAKPVETVIYNGVAQKDWTVQLKTRNLPDDGEKLVQSFQAEKNAIQAEADQKISERRDAITKSLQALQDKYAREGKLDEAVVIRDYIRAGLPGLDGNKIWIRK